LAAVLPGFQPGGLIWKRGYDLVRFCGPGGKMPPDTAGKDARHYKLEAVPECAQGSSAAQVLLALAGRICYAIGEHG
jgi:hypothetical protein